MFLKCIYAGKINGVDQPTLINGNNYIADKLYKKTKRNPFERYLINGNIYRASRFEDQSDLIAPGKKVVYINRDAQKFCNLIYSQVCVIISFFCYSFSQSETGVFFVLEENSRIGIDSKLFIPESQWQELCGDSGICSNNLPNRTIPSD